ncbi:IGF-like family receptor 1 [Archocentrus centrarchus]|uniref:IGF-like family receptor 1 n=1 Tax=Archocentrus centrarchus TaxID=63155 RepID=UPI0011EA3D0E|nr:IGF-like family receptor 1 [Archocentrus centrarchus]
MHSDRCFDPTTRWNNIWQQCVRCLSLPITPGREIAPNCGYDDHGGRHETDTKPCKNNSYNDGLNYNCTPCSTCPLGYRTVTPCNRTADTVCDKTPVSSVPATKIPVTEPATSKFTSASTTLMFQRDNLTQSTLPPTQSVSAAAWAVPLAILISILAALSAYVVSSKWKKAKSFNRQPSYINQGFAPLTGSNGSDVEDVLNAAILSAPLQTVLDNLDVLEELVILLDPESHGRKNTKHLASHCAFPSTWITYIYSMKDSKSPLKAVLEAVTCKYPDWTVGHFVKLLKLMERNDAIAALAKLRVNKTDV